MNRALSHAAALVLALVLASSARAQVAGLCGAGKNCRATSFIATNPTLYSPSVTIPTNTYLCWADVWNPYGCVASARWTGAALLIGSETAVPVTLTGAQFSASSTNINGTTGLTIASTTLTTGLAAPTADAIAGESTSGRLYLSDGNTWRDLGAGNHPVLNARTLLVDLRDAGDLGWAHAAPYVGGVSPAVTETCNGASVQPLSTTGDFGSFSREARECPTTAVLGNVSSVLVSETRWATSNRTRVCFRAGLVSTADVVFMAGETTAGSFANPESAPNKSGMWVRFDSTVPDTDWMLCTSDGVSAATCTSSGVAATSGGLFCLDQREGSGVTLWVNGRARVRHTTNLPNAATAMAIGAALETQAASSKAFQLSRLTIEVP